MFDVQVLTGEGNAPKPITRMSGHDVIAVSDGEIFKVKVSPPPGAKDLYAVELKIDDNRVCAFHALDTIGKTSAGPHSHVQFSHWEKSDEEGNVTKFPLKFSRTKNPNEEDEEERPSEIRQNWNQNKLDVTIYQGFTYITPDDIYQAKSTLPSFTSGESEKIRVKTGTSVGAGAGDPIFGGKPFWPKGSCIMKHQHKELFRKTIFFRDSFFIDVLNDQADRERAKTNQSGQVEDSDDLYSSVFSPVDTISSMPNSQARKKQKTSTDVIVIEE